MPPGASERSLSASLWLGKVFACPASDERLSEQMRGVERSGVVCVCLGDLDCLRFDGRHVNFDWAASRL